VIARRPPVAAQPLHDQAQRQPLAGIVERGRGSFRVRNGASWLAGREGCLGGPDLQLR